MSTRFALPKVSSSEAWEVSERACNVFFRNRGIYLLSRVFDRQIWDVQIYRLMILGTMAV